MLVFTVTHKHDVDGTLNLINRPNEENVFEFVDHDSDGNPILKLETEHDISRDLDLNDGVIKYTVKRLWTEDYLEEHFFSTVINEAMGSTTFVPIVGDLGGEWGVDVVTLSVRRYAFRPTNPMNDDEWEIGTLDDIADALNATEENWILFSE